MDCLYNQFKLIEEEMDQTPTHTKEHSIIQKQYIRMIHRIRNMRIKLLNEGYEPKELPFPVYEELPSYMKRYRYKKFFYNLSIEKATNYN